MKGLASGATPASGGVSREGGLDGPVATGRGEWFPPPSRRFLVRVSPQGQAGRSGAFEREARVPGGSLRGQPRIGSSLPAERATFRRGTPGGDFRAGGNLGEAGKPKLPNGNGKGRRGGIPIPSLGTAALSGAPAAAAGIASLPGMRWSFGVVARWPAIPLCRGQLSLPGRQVRPSRDIKCKVLGPCAPDALYHSKPHPPGN